MKARICAVTAALVAAVAPTTGVHAAGSLPFTFLATGFTQALYATSLPFAGGVAFAPNGDPLVAFVSLYRVLSASTITVHGSTIHPTTMIPASLGLGLANSVDGGVYANLFGSGVVKIDPATGSVLAGPFGNSGNELGIALDPQTHNLVYAGSDCTYYFVSPDLTTAGQFSSVAACADGIAFDPTGNFLFASVAGQLAILDRHNTLVQTIALSSGCCTDGIAFHGGAPQFVISNNTDGTMTRYNFPNNDFTLAPTQSTFASGGFRGDILQVGQDGCLYLMQGGTRFDDGTETSDGSLVQLCGGFVPPKPTAKTTLTESVAASHGGVPFTTVFTYQEANTGTVPISSVAVSGSACGAATYQSGDTNTNGVLDPNETWVFTCLHTFNAPGSFTDNATATGNIANTGQPAPVETASATVNVTASFAPGGGSFVIGDNNAVVGNSVTFWGAQWAKDNSFLSGGSAAHSFKGFAENPTAPPLSCGANWSADPGNSTPPPDGPLPAYMAVIVTSSADKSGSTISGNTVHIVIVKTNPGYAPNPGHAGTGTVVAVVC